MGISKCLVYIIILIFVISEIMNKKSVVYKVFISFIALYFMLILILLNDVWYKIFINPQMLIISCFLIYGVLLKIYKNIRNVYYDKISKLDLDTLQRDINMDYNPSIAGYLMNQTVEFKELYADILNLYAKKIIKINTKDEKVISYGEKYEKEKYNLKDSDKYILENIEDKFSRFDFSIWEKKVREEYKEYGFSKERKSISDKNFYTINILIIISSIIISLIVSNSAALGFIYGLMLATIFDFINYLIHVNKYNRDIYLTTKGKREIKNCLKLKRFMKEYTLLKDRKLEEVIIYEKYIPYAISLGINTRYEEIIFDEEALMKIMQQAGGIEFYEEN